jgi:hypothetical protein
LADIRCLNNQRYAIASFRRERVKREIRSDCERDKQHGNEPDSAEYACLRLL